MIINIQQRSTCDVVFDIQHVTEGVVVLEHVQIKRGEVFSYLGPHAVVGRGPPASQHVVVSLGEVNKLGQWVIQTTVEAHYQLELWVRVKVHFTVGCVLHLGDSSKINVTLTVMESAFHTLHPVKKKNLQTELKDFEQHLFDHLPIAAENRQWCSCVVRSNIVFLSTAHLHRKQVTLMRRLFNFN